nr:hypothetical protein CFP56_07760 [Quercus suber]
MVKGPRCKADVHLPLRLLDFFGFSAPAPVSSAAGAAVSTASQTLGFLIDLGLLLFSLTALSSSVFAAEPPLSCSPPSGTARLVEDGGEGVGDGGLSRRKTEGEGIVMASAMDDTDRPPPCPPQVLVRSWADLQSRRARDLAVLVKSSVIDTSTRAGAACPEPAVDNTHAQGTAGNGRGRRARMARAKAAQSIEIPRESTSRRRAMEEAACVQDHGIAGLCDRVNLTCSTPPHTRMDLSLDPAGLSDRDASGTCYRGLVGETCHRSQSVSKADVHLPLRLLDFFGFSAPAPVSSAAGAAVSTASQTLGFLIDLGLLLFSLTALSSSVFAAEPPLSCSPPSGTARLVEDGGEGVGDGGLSRRKTEGEGIVMASAMDDTDRPPPCPPQVLVRSWADLQSRRARDLAVLVKSSVIDTSTRAGAACPEPAVDNTHAQGTAGNGRGRRARMARAKAAQSIEIPRESTSRRRAMEEAACVQDHGIAGLCDRVNLTCSTPPHTRMDLSLDPAGLSDRDASGTCYRGLVMMPDKRSLFDVQSPALTSS